MADLMLCMSISIGLDFASWCAMPPTKTGRFHASFYLFSLVAGVENCDIDWVYSQSVVRSEILEIVHI